MPQCLTGQLPIGFAVLNDRDAVDKQPLDAVGELVRLVEGRLINQYLRVKDDHVGEVAGLEVAALRQLDDVGRQAGATTDGLYKRNDFFPDRIQADLAREGAV